MTYFKAIHTAIKTQKPFSCLTANGVITVTPSGTGVTIRYRDGTEKYYMPLNAMNELRALSADIEHLEREGAE